MIITSTSNPTIKAIRRLHRPTGRRDQGRTIIEGPNALDAARRYEVSVVEILCLADDDETQAFASKVGTPPTMVTDVVLAAASDTSHPRGPLLVIDIPPFTTVRRVPTVVLVDVADPGNVGTIVRSATAFGWDVAVAGSTADVWAPKTLRSSAATALGARIALVNDVVGDVASAGLLPIALVVEGGLDPTALTLDAPPALLVGSEAHGLDERTLAATTRRVTIPMPGDVESLNASVAASLGMYALADRRLH